MKNPYGYEVKVKVIYPDAYKDFGAYEDAVIRLEEKGYFIALEVVAGEDGKSYCIMANDGYHRQ